MLYTYECRVHGEFDEAMSARHMRGDMPCPECGRKSPKVIVLGHGGVHMDNASWINDELRGCLQPQAAIETGVEKPIETRGELNRYLKRKNITAIG